MAVYAEVGRKAYYDVFSITFLAVYDFFNWIKTVGGHGEEAFVKLSRFNQRAVDFAHGEFY
jgi:hypothetical protein